MTKKKQKKLHRETSKLKAATNLLSRPYLTVKDIVFTASETYSLGALKFYSKISSVVKKVKLL